MRIPDSVILEIRENNPIEEVVAPYVNLKHAGRNLNGLCPFHSEKTPSFTVFPETNSYYCFGCGAGGDSVNFIRSIENLDYIEALKLLADRAGIVIPEGDFDDSYAKLKKRVYDINRETARFYNGYLYTNEGKWALTYLTGRGLSKKTINHFGLGVAPDEWDLLLKHLKSKGFTLNEMEQANVISKGNRGGYYDRFRKRVMFPIIDVRGNVIAFSGRRSPDFDKGGKYINSSDTPVYKKSKSIFGLNFAKDFSAERIIIVEGNMDVVSLHQAGFQNTVAPLGTAFTEEQARILSKYTKEIVLCFDSDAAGQKAISRALEVLKNSSLSVRVISVPDGKDPDEFIKMNGSDGREKFGAILDGASSEIEFRLYSAKNGLDLSTADGKAKYLGRAADELSKLNDSIAVDLYAGKLSEEFSVSKQVLADSIEQKKKANYRKRQKQEFKTIISPLSLRGGIIPEKVKYARAVRAEEEILAVLIRNPDYFKKVELNAEYFISSLNKRILSTLYNCYTNNTEFDVSVIGSSFSPEEIGYITSLTAKHGLIMNPQAVLTQSLQVLKEEKENRNLAESGKMPVDEWADDIASIIRSKKEKSHE